MSPTTPQILRTAARLMDHFGYSKYARVRDSKGERRPFRSLPESGDSICSEMAICLAAGTLPSVCDGSEEFEQARTALDDFRFMTGSYLNDINDHPETTKAGMQQTLIRVAERIEAEL